MIRKSGPTVFQISSTDPNVWEKRSQTESRLDEIACLPACWDGAQALPVSVDAMSEARRMIERIMGVSRVDDALTYVPYTSAPIADGGLQVEWRGENADIEVQFGPDRRNAYLVVDRRGPKIQYEESDNSELDEMFAKIVDVLS